MKRARLALVGVLALAIALSLPTAKARAQLPVSGTGTGVSLTGVLNDLKFVANNGQLLAVGNLTATVTDAAGKVLGSVTNLPVQLPLLLGPGATTGSCTILDLVLGPLHLDLLGLVVDLNQVHLTITAQQGPGNLLGNLLCAVANLLNRNPLNVNGLAGLLNNILRNL